MPPAAAAPCGPPLPASPPPHAPAAAPAPGDAPRCGAAAPRSHRASSAGRAGTGLAVVGVRVHVELLTSKPHVHGKPHYFPLPPPATARQAAAPSSLHLDDGDVGLLGRLNARLRLALRLSIGRRPLCRQRRLHLLPLLVALGHLRLAALHCLLQRCRRAGCRRGSECHDRSTARVHPGIASSSALPAKLDITVHPPVARAGCAPSPGVPPPPSACVPAPCKGD